MGKITYTNKVALNENPEVADINKVTDDDMNEIKSVVNTNDDNVGNLTNLPTTDKTSIVNSIIEINTNKASTNEVVISNTQPSASDNKLWIDTGEVASASSEITNSYSTSTGLGYSCNYVNQLVPKNIISTRQLNETSYTTNTNYKSHVVPVSVTIAQVGTNLELTSDGGIKIKGDYKYVKVSASIGLGSSNSTNSYGINLGKGIDANGNITNSFYLIVDQYNHTNTFKLMSTNEILVSVAQNDVIYLGVYVFTQGTVQVRNGYLTVEVVD